MIALKKVNKLKSKSKQSKSNKKSRKAVRKSIKYKPGNLISNFTTRPSYTILHSFKERLTVLVFSRTDLLDLNGIQSIHTCNAVRS